VNAMLDEALQDTTFVLLGVFLLVGIATHFRAREEECYRLDKGARDSRLLAAKRDLPGRIRSFFGFAGDRDG